MTWHPRARGRRQARRLGWTWLLLTLVLAAHVADEAAHDFLSFWNPAVAATPLPTFSFGVWLGGLAMATGLLLALTPVAFRGPRWIATWALVYGLAMTGNGVVHVVWSVRVGVPVPGVLTALPLVLAGTSLAGVALALRRSERQGDREARGRAGAPPRAGTVGSGRAPIRRRCPGG